MEATTEFTYKAPSNFDVEYAQRILKLRADFRKKIFSKYLKLVELQLQSGRACDLSMNQKVDGLSIEFTNMTEGDYCKTFMLYDHNSAAELNDGIKLIERFFKTGESIPFYSMTCKRIEGHATTDAGAK